MAIGRSLRAKWQFISELSMQTAHENPSLSTVIIFIATILPWIAGYVLPAMRSLFCTFELQFWQRVVQYLTQSVLFLLVNIVILLIWLTSERSGALNTADNAATKDENQRLCALSNESSPQVLTTSRKATPLSSPPSSPPALHPSNASHCLQVSESQPCADIVEDSVKEQKTASSQEKKAAQHQAKQPEAMATTESKTFEATKNTGKRSLSTATLKSDEEAVKVKLTERSATFPRPASRVIATDNVSAGKASAVEGGMSKEVVGLVIEKDELNERIEAFFAKFREQLRQESLRHYY